MKNVFWTAIFLYAQVLLPARGQGVINFNNRVPPQIDARVTYLDGTPVGSGFTAQLYGGPVGTPIGALVPLLPTTIFRPGPAAGYVIPVAVTEYLPSIGPSDSMTVVMRAFDGATWDTSSCRGESNPIRVLPGSPSGVPGTLDGLRPFQVDCIPEPTVLALWSTGLLVFGLLVGIRVRILSSISSIDQNRIGERRPNEVIPAD
jgi:hypothetical protein